MLQYKMNICPTGQHFDEKGELLSSALLYFFQKAAEAHAAQAGAGFDDLIRQNLIWVVTKLKYRMQGVIKPGGHYSLLTFPKPKHSLIYQRDYLICDSSGEELVLGSSQWCIVNFFTRRVERSGFDYEGEFCERVLFPEGFERIRLPELSYAGRHLISERDLDRNDHTNNCRYADMVKSVLRREEGIRSFLIYYNRETRLKDEILFFSGRSEEGEVVSGRLPDGSTVFTCRVS